MSFIPDKVNPFKDATDWINDKIDQGIEFAVSGVGNYLGLLGSRLTSDPKDISGNVVKGIITKNPLTSTLLVAGSFPVSLFNKQLSDKMYIEGMNSLVTMGTDDLLSWLLPPSLVKFVNKKLLPIVSSNDYLRRSLDWVRNPGRIWRAWNANPSPVVATGTSFTSGYILNHPADPILGEYQIGQASIANKCLRCDRRGHVSVQCYALSKLSGGKIRVTSLERQISESMSGMISGSSVQNATFGFGGGGGSSGNSDGPSEVLTGV